MRERIENKKTYDVNLVEIEKKELSAFPRCFYVGT